MRGGRIDLDRLDPDWKFAFNHGKASKPGTPSNRDRSMVMCPCCLNVIQKEPVSIWQNSKQLFFLGYGFPLFYHMVQFCIMLVFMLIISNSTVMLYHAVNQPCILKYHPNRAETLAYSSVYNQAHLGQSFSGRLLANSSSGSTLDQSKLNACHSFFVLLSRSTKVLYQIDIIIRIVSWIGTAAMLLYFRDSQRKLSKYHGQRNLKLSDYAIILKNLPKVQRIKQRITKFLTDETLFNLQQSKVQIQDIILLPDASQFYKKEKQKKKIIQQKKKLIQDISNIQQINQLDVKIKEINFQLHLICQNIIDKQERDQLISQKAIVILSQDITRKSIIQRFSQIDKGQFFEYFEDRAYDVTLKTAPDPREIIWKNINYPKSKRKLWVFFGWIISVLFLASVTVVFFFLIQAKSQMFQQSLHQNQLNPSGHAWAVVIVYITIIGVQLFNKFLMKVVLHKIGDLQKPQTSSQYQFSYAFKYTLGMFFTTALMTLAVQAIRFDNYTHQYGVVEQQTIIFFFNAFFVSLLWISHPQYYIRKIARAFYRGNKNMTQKQANQIMEDYPYDMGKRYAQVLETLWFTYLYASLIPIGPFITFVGLSIYYWIDKYNLLRRSKIESAIQSKLPLNAVTLLQLILIWKPLGDLIFDLQLRGGVILPSTIVMLALGTIFIFIPWNKIQQFFFHQKFNVKQQPYQKISYKFIDSYRTLNPVTRYHNLTKILKKRNDVKRSSSYISSKDPVNVKVAQLRQQAPLIHPVSGIYKFSNSSAASQSVKNMKTTSFRQSIASMFNNDRIKQQRQRQKSSSKKIKGGSYLNIFINDKNDRNKREEIYKQDSSNIRIKQQKQRQKQEPPTNMKQYPIIYHTNPKQKTSPLHKTNYSPSIKQQNKIIREIQEPTSMVFINQNQKEKQKYNNKNNRLQQQQQSNSNFLSVQKYHNKNYKNKNNNQSRNKEDIDDLLNNNKNDNDNDKKQNLNQNLNKKSNLSHLEINLNVQDQYQQ